MKTCPRLLLPRRRWVVRGLLMASGLFLFSLFSPLLHPHRHVSWVPDASAPSRHLLQAATEKPTPLFPPNALEPYMSKGAVILPILGVIYMFIALAAVCDEFFVPALDVIIEKLGISQDVAGATFMAAGGTNIRRHGWSKISNEFLALRMIAAARNQSTVLTKMLLTTSSSTARVGSAPELFTSVIGVFISYDDVGIGTIVGSAVFNILFVIGMCAIFSKTVLHLTWWPLVRDTTFYSISLIALIVCFFDERIFWYEALTLLGIYAAYVTFMKFNETCEVIVKSCIRKNLVTRVRSTDQLVVEKRPGSGRRAPTAIIHSGSKFRQGLVQLMIHSIDPMHEGKLDDKVQQMQAIASLQAHMEASKQKLARSQGGTLSGEDPHDVVVQDYSPTAVPAISNGTTTDGASSHPDTEVTAFSEDPADNASAQHVSFRPSHASAMSVTPIARPLHTPWNNASSLHPNALPTPHQYPSAMSAGTSTPAGHSNIMPHICTGCLPKQNSIVLLVHLRQDDDLEEDENRPLDLSWPNTCFKRMSYLFMMPIVIPLWLTLPDTRTPRGKRFFVITFLGSIIWIAAFSYLMVWWATLVGETFAIPNEVMGLTFLAAGTSIPDLITSVIVARKGHGDMAVSSSVGSNIFDVTVGLPLPWFLYGAINLGTPVVVNSEGMICSILLLFSMLVIVFLSIVIFRWKMNKGLGITMFLLYGVFLAVSLLIEYKTLPCIIKL
ncbi:unnamed protein product [Cyprideis torosa]|uniref:Sodium/calcium exchanger membrane region domain-containing protein n=1 Tax=Cyprideis torosa TaxID=163714 RepID=A0A7R8ZL26_9CRUS|nr:unnamed protein product [Cyprideis torosa]CAG0890810.1 unnamed protein product [Cyprideis torosa]